MKKINPNIDTFHGINNSLNPCSPQYRQGMAYDAQNSRINESGIWAKAAELDDVSLGNTTASGIPVTLDCVSQWKLDETTGTDAVDAYGDHDGTISADASTLTATGKLGTCLDLDGTAYVTIADDDDFSFGDASDDSECSFAAWIYINSDASGDMVILAKQDLDDSAEEWRIWVDQTGSDYKLCLSLFDADNSNRIELKSPALTLGAWVFVAGTYDGSGANTGITLYVNGISATTSDGDQGTYTAMHNTTSVVSIGGKNNSGGTAYEWLFDGKVDSVMVFNKELSSNEVYQLYNNGDGNADIDESLLPHYKEVTIEDAKYVAKYLKYNTALAVGTNKYAYFVADDMGSARAVYHWNGTDKASAAEYVDNATDFDYALAGLGRPTEDLFTETNEVTSVGGTPINEYGGRQEKGRYYYMYTWFDTERKSESLPSPVKEWDSLTWISQYESCQYPFISIKPEVQEPAPTSGSPRYDTNTKVRIYRTKRTYTDSHVVNSLNDFYFVDDVDYNAGLTAVTFTSASWTFSKTGGFADVAVGDLIYVYDPTGSHISEKVFKIATNANDNTITVEDDGGTYANDTVKISFMILPDYLHDGELVEKYEGRGTPPPTDIDFLAPFNNRMYYFKDNTAYWSSAGRPEEVAQEYTLTYKLLSAAATTTTSTFTTKPVLSTGGYGEAKYEIAELSGETIIAAYPWRNRLYVWTQEGTCGYLEGTYTTEGIRFYLLRKGIGVISDKTLAHTPYGLIGADREGIWQMDNNGGLFRLSKGWIDIDDSTKSTHAKQSSLEHSFGVWSPELDEYVWCVSNFGEDTICRQIAYNPLRRIFSGIYAYPALFGGCGITTTTGLHNYLTNAKTFNADSTEALEQVLEFWMGQHSLDSVKEDIEVEIIYESVTADKNVSIGVYQNNIASKTGAITFPSNYSTSAVTHDDDNLVGIVKPNASGRMFLVRIVIPSDCEAPVIALGYIANHVIWGEKSLR